MYEQRRTHSRFCIQYLLDQRYAIRRRLARPRACPREDISILQGEWDGLGLDQSGMGKFHVGQSAQNPCIQQMRKSAEGCLGLDQSLVSHFSEIRPPWIVRAVRTLISSGRGLKTVSEISDTNPVLDHFLAVAAT